MIILKLLAGIILFILTSMLLGGIIIRVFRTKATNKIYYNLKEFEENERK